MISQTLTPELIHLLNQIVSESEKDLNETLKEKGARLASFTENGWKVTQDFIDSFKSYNRFICFEEKEGKPIAAIVFQINDSVTRENLEIQGDFAIFFKAITAREERNSGAMSRLMKEALDFVHSQTTNPTIIGCAMIKPIVENSQQKIHVLNLERYAMMMTVPGTKLQIRYNDEKGQYGRECYQLKDFVKNNKIDEEKIRNLVEEHKPRAAAEGKGVLGFYLRNQVSRL